ncbi:hypothetical protein K438DRAFT_1780240 [Mycena galopus ATCC 62051]|nr:hypothetical protein K438DRAFT_1780240 [Mycena galopus ATCC 62051]
MPPTVTITELPEVPDRRGAPPLINSPYILISVSNSAAGHKEVLSASTADANCNSDDPRLDHHLGGESPLASPPLHRETNPEYTDAPTLLSDVSSWWSTPRANLTPAHVSGPSTSDGHDGHPTNICTWGGARQGYLKELRMAIHGMAAHPLSAPEIPVTFKDCFFNTRDVHQYVLALLPLGVLFSYGRVSVASRREVMALASSRIVGSVALATLSFRQDFASPDNMNVITSPLTESIWIQFMCGTLGFYLQSDCPCDGFYSLTAKRFMTFAHPQLPNKIITVTTSRSRDIFELFLGAQTTLMCNAVTAYELVSVYEDLTTRWEGVRGYQAQFANQRHSEVSPASVFPSKISLHCNTRAFRRPCGSACPGIVRWTADLKGISHWKWGGVDGMEWDEDQDVKAMGRAHIRFRLGDICRNTHCPIHRTHRPSQPQPRRAAAIRTLVSLFTWLILEGQNDAEWQKSVSALRACQNSLAGYGIRFTDMNLLMHGVPAIISGSTVTALLEGPSFAPNVPTTWTYSLRKGLELA